MAEFVLINIIIDFNSQGHVGGILSSFGTPQVVTMTTYLVTNLTIIIVCSNLNILLVEYNFNIIVKTKICLDKILVLQWSHPYK